MKPPQSCPSQQRWDVQSKDTPTALPLLMLKKRRDFSSLVYCFSKRRSELQMSGIAYGPVFMQHPELWECMWPPALPGPQEAGCSSPVLQTVLGDKKSSVCVFVSGFIPSTQHSSGGIPRSTQPAHCFNADHCKTPKFWSLQRPGAGLSCKGMAETDQDPDGPPPFPRVP